MLATVTAQAWEVDSAPARGSSPRLPSPAPIIPQLHSPVPRCSYHRHLTLNQFRSKDEEAVVVPLRPPVFERSGPRCDLFRPTSTTPPCGRDQDCDRTERASAPLRRAVAVAVAARRRAVLLTEIKEAEPFDLQYCHAGSNIRGDDHVSVDRPRTPNDACL
jgi:hypothetical protein